MVQTSSIQMGLDYFTPWLDPENKQPFILVGPEGCGKGFVLLHSSIIIIIIINNSIISIIIYINMTINIYYKSFLLFLGVM